MQKCFYKVPSFATIVDFSMCVFAFKMCILRMILVLSVTIILLMVCACSFFKRRTCFNETLVGYKILLQGAMHYFRHWHMFTLKLLPKILMLKMISVLSGTILTTNNVWLCSLETCLDDILASHKCFYKELLHLLIGFNCCICPVPLPVVLLAGRYLPSPFDQVY